MAHRLHPHPQRRPHLRFSFGWRADDGVRLCPVPNPPGFPIQRTLLPEEAIMCDRIGCTHFPKLSDMDFSGRAVASRRGFLKAAAAVTTITMGMGGMTGTAHAAAGIKGTHGTGFCNLNIFLAHSRQYAKAAGVELEFINTPTFAEQVTFLGMGQVDIGLMPYTSFMALYDAGAPVKIVAGGGVEGCAIVARPGLDSPEKLKGKTLGTFQLDTLEVMPYDYLKKHGISFKDVKVRYMGNTPEAVEAFKAGALDWICTIEPYASALVNDVKGAVMLTNGIDMYGKGYTDCVLAARASLVKDNPAGLKAIIKSMMQAQYDAETQTEAVLKELVGKYYKTSMENAKIAQGKQPAIVDARSQTQFILDRTDSVIEMGYIKKKPGRDAIDWTVLEEVIKENPDLYGKLKYKSAV
jgi:NitT/TauT family transport system substrate-binding protein